MAMLKQLNQLAGPRSVPRGGIYTLAALNVPTWAARGDRLDASQHVGRRTAVGPEHIAVCRALLPLFAQNDAAFGGGGVRESLRRFLAVSVSEWLGAPAEPRFRRELCAVAAQMTYLCAFTHFDSNLHHQAQQYYLISLALAHEAGDRASYALGLRGLSVQAQALGHFRQADRLATQAVSLGIPHAEPHQQAFLLGQLALTRATSGDPKSSARHLSAAEQRLEVVSSTRAAVGAYHAASLSLHHAAVARGLRDHQRATRALQASLRHRPDGENRSRAITTAHLAEAQLGLGQLDRACYTWSHFLTHYPQISSARADDRLQTLMASLRPHQRNRTAAALLDQARHLKQQHGRQGNGRE
uniref:Transcriptional regulator n=1 Tax=Streptomyces sp. NBC_00003 TaxID=2903608 RepID=A0AAU2UY57_9ACTN